MAKLYDRTVAELMVDAAAEVGYPATRNDLVGWFAERYPKVKASTVRAHVVGLTANDSSRHHYAWLASREPLFTREPDGRLRPYDQAIDAESADETGEAGDGGPPLEFALEAFLEEFLDSNWEGIDWGRPLEIWESEADPGTVGHQLSTPVGRLDFLAAIRARMPWS